MQRKQKSILARAWDFVRQEIRWLAPGLGVKRWVVMILIGTTLIGLGFAILLLEDKGISNLNIFQRISRDLNIK